MITELTKEQEERMRQYQEKYIRLATSTEPADRSRAEMAAKQLAKTDGINPESVLWIDDSAIIDSINPSLIAEFESFAKDPLRHTLRFSAWNSCNASLKEIVSEPLNEFIWDSLEDSLSDVLWDSLKDSLKYSIYASLWDAEWICQYMYCAEVLGAKYESRSTELLHLYNEMVASCFAMWFGPETIVLCERPASMEVVCGKVVNIEWRGQSDE